MSRAYSVSDPRLFRAPLGQNGRTDVSDRCGEETLLYLVNYPLLTVSCISKLLSFLNADISVQQIFIRVQRSGCGFQRVAPVFDKNHPIGDF